jgi:hypothetical protein
VKAPGTETRTTFLPAHSFEASYSWGRPQAVGSASVMGAHLGVSVWHYGAMIAVLCCCSVIEDARHEHLHGLLEEGYVLELDALG